MSKTVLISPLDWGLGHATRMVPIIEYYMVQNYQVVLGGNGSSLNLLIKRFPELTVETIPSYQVKYSTKVGFAVQMLLSLPTIYLGIKREKKRVKELHEKYHFSLIVSDNRFGVYHKSVRSLFVTHQLNIRFPMFERTIFKVQKKLIEKFDCCLVPDFPMQQNLAGVLSVLKPKQNLKIPVHYLGALSRFYSTSLDEKAVKYHYVAVLSGPEPHKTGLTDLLIEAFSESNQQLAIITYDYQLTRQLPANIHLFLEVNDQVFLSIISQSETLISRSGYTTLMDLIYLKKKVFFIPTPGQTEQIYLAQYAAKNGWANYCLQHEFSPEKISNSGTGFPFGKSPLHIILGKVS